MSSGEACNPPAQREVERWRVAKGGRELRCIAVYKPTGIDLRLIEGEDFRRNSAAEGWTSGGGEGGGVADQVA